MKILLFNEFISSVNFSLLFHQAQSLFDPNYGLGYYIQGIPSRPGVDFFWGTSAGIRILPLLAWLAGLQSIFGSHWAIAYLAISLVLIPASFLYAVSLIKRLDFWSYLGAVFYTCNQWVIYLYMTGAWQQAVGYALLPLLVALPQKIDLKNLAKRVLAFSILVSVVTIAHPLYLMYPSFFLAGHLITNLHNKLQLKRLLVFYCLSGILIGLLNMYQLAPSLLFPELVTSHYPGYGVGAVLFNSKNSTLFNVLRFDVWPNPNFPIPGVVQFVQLVPILVVLIMFLSDPKKRKIFFAGLVFFAFMAKGLHPPLSRVALWLYNNIVFFYFSRFTSRFLIPIALYSAFIISTEKINFRRPTTKILMAAVFGLIIIVSDSHFFQENPVTSFSEIAIPNEYSDLNEYIAKNVEGDSKMLSIPNDLKVSDYKWYSSNKPSFANTIFESSFPMTIKLANSSHYPDNFSNQISAFLQHKYIDSGNMNVLLPLGVKYLLLDNNFKSDKDINPGQGSVEIFKSGNLHMFDLFPGNDILDTNLIKPLLVIGDFNSISNRYKSGSEQPIVLINQTPNIDMLFDNRLRQLNLVSDVYNPGLTLTGEYLAKNYDLDLFDQAKSFTLAFVPFEPYMLSDIDSHGYLFTNPKPVVSNGKGEITVTRYLEPGQYQILIKGYSRKSSAHLALEIGKNRKDIYLDPSGLQWTDLGSVDIEQKIGSVQLFSLSENQAAIDHLLIVPKTVMDSEAQKISNLLFHWRDIQKSESVHYLTYLYSYGRYWKSENSELVLLSNGYAMTFVSFTAQPGLPVYYPNTIYKIAIRMSVWTLIVSIISLTGLIIFSNRKH